MSTAISGLNTRRLVFQLEIELVKNYQVNDPLVAEGIRVPESVMIVEIRQRILADLGSIVRNVFAVICTTKMRQNCLH